MIEIGTILKGQLYLIYECPLELTGDTSKRFDRYFEIELRYKGRFMGIMMVETEGFWHELFIHRFDNFINAHSERMEVRT
jgi:hypothetical protein